MLIQLEYRRRQKGKLEDRGDTSSETYIKHVAHIKSLEEQIGDYDGKGLDYDGKQCIELPKDVSTAIANNDIKSVVDWLGSPIDMKRLSTRHPDSLNSTLVHLAIYTANSDLLSILLQYGADVNALDSEGWNPLMLATKPSRFEQAKILLEWGVEISLPRSASEYGLNDRDLFIEATKKQGNIKLANLISSEFGGRRCEVMNLPNHPHLNGKACVVEKYITKKKKYKIIFEGSGNAVLVGPNNLKRRDRTPLDCGYYISFDNGKMSRREFATKEECQAYVSSLGSGSGNVKETEEELSNLKL